MKTCFLILYLYSVYTWLYAAMNCGDNTNAVGNIDGDINAYDIVARDVKRKCHTLNTCVFVVLRYILKSVAITVHICFHMGHNVLPNVTFFATAAPRLWPYEPVCIEICRYTLI